MTTDEYWHTIAESYREKSQDPCEDAISRQTAIDEIMGRRPDAHYPDYYASIIRNLPSVHEEPRTGHWIIITPTDMYCSECNEIEHLDTSRRFCAFCGAEMVEPAEMVGPQESEEQA